MRPGLRRGLLAAGGVTLAVAMIGAWRWTPLGELADPERIAAHIQALVRSPWAPLSLAGVYLAANATLFPVIALNMALILALGMAWGTAWALYGTVLSGVVVFLLGARFGQPVVARLGQPRIQRALRLVRRSGLPGLVLVRLVPVAPYPVVNLVLGAGGVRLSTFTLGTVAGVLPGLLLLGIVGFQLRQVFASPDATGVGVLAGLALVIVALAAAIRRRLATRLDTD